MIGLIRPIRWHLFRLSLRFGSRVSPPPKPTVEVEASIVEETRTDETKTLMCRCGNEEYHIKWDIDSDHWAVCTACGRPTSVVGIGRSKQRRWYAEHP